MIIKNLSLKNFGSIRKANLNFQRGFNLISGANGQGKSHIFRALAYLLLNDTAGTIEESLNWDSDSFKISTELEYLNQTFKISNSFNGQNSSKELYIGNEFYRKSDATRVLSEYFDPSLCKASMISFQGEIDIVDSTAAKRRDNLKLIYDLDFTKDLKELKLEKEKIEITIAEIDKKIYYYDNKVYEITEMLDLPFEKHDYDSYQTEVEKLIAVVALAEQKQKEMARIKQEILSYQENVREAKISIDNIEKKKIKEKSNLDAIKKSLNEDFEIELIKLEKSLGDDLEKRQREIITDLSKIELVRILKFKDGQLKILKEEEKDLIFNLMDSKKILEACKNGDCPTCGKDFNSSDVSYHEEQIEQHQNSLGKVQESIKDEEDLREELDRQKKDLEVKMNKKKLLEIELENEVEKIITKKKNIQEKIDREKQSIEEKKKHIEFQIQTSENKITEYDSQSESIFKNQMDYEEKLVAYEEELSEEVEDNFEENQEKILVLKEKIEKYENIEQKNNIYRERNIKIEKEQKADKKELALLQEEKEKLDDESEVIENSSGILRKNFPNFVIGRVIHRIEAGMNDFLDETYDGRYHVNIEETKIGLDILYGQKKRDVKLASGAERNLFNLSLKNAFCEMAGLRILNLDEIDSFMDTEISNQVYSVLNTMIQEKRLDQVFMITHNEEIKDLIQNKFNGLFIHVENGEANVV